MSEVITDSVESEETEPVDIFAEAEDASKSDEDGPQEQEGIEPKEMHSEDLEELYKAQIEAEDISIDRPIYIKLKGKVTKIDNVNDLRNLSERGLVATQKMQEISKDRKFLQYLDDNGITKEQVDALILSKGQEPVVQDEQVVEVEEVAQTILDSDYADDFRSTADMLPEDVKELMGTNPQLLQDFYGDIQSGLAQKIMPQVEQLMAVKGLGFYEAYATAGQSIVGKDDTMEQKKQMLRSAPKPNTQSLNGNNADIWNMSDEEFDKYMN